MIDDDEILKADRPPDAGGFYRNPDGLLRYLEKRSAKEIRKTARWVKMHYTDTDGLLARLRVVYKKAAQKV